jgi:hypothetical protein
VLYRGDWKRTEPLQRFVDEVWQDGKKLRARVLQCVINRYLIPRPQGPSIVLHGKQHNDIHKGGVGGISVSSPKDWLYYVSPGLHHHFGEGNET